MTDIFSDMVARYLLRFGLLSGGAVVAYNGDEVQTAAIGGLRFGRAAVAVSVISCNS